MRPPSCGALLTGCTWCAGKWVAQIRLPGHPSPHFIGNFDDEVLAARAYDRVALEHGLEDKLNFPQAAAKSVAVPQVAAPRGSSQYRGVSYRKDTGK